MLDITQESQLVENFRSGFVAVVGRPNVGKSTLMNAYLGQKVAIVSHKPQTTRNRLLGIITGENYQVIFVDTPGIHNPLHKLGETMVETAVRAIPDADLVLFVVDASVPPTNEDRLVADAIQAAGEEIPVLLVLNKIDLLSSEICPYTDAYMALLPAQAWQSVSATRGDNQDELLELILEHLPPGPLYFPADQVTDQQTRFIVAELIRESALQQLHQEVPHALAVVTNEFKERSQDIIYIAATLFVERESQKGIVIGQGGKTLKSIGEAARAEIEDLVDSRVYLELWVKVRPKWRKKDEELRRLGYSLPSS